MVILYTLQRVIRPELLAALRRADASAHSEFHSRWRETLLNLLAILILLSLCIVWPDGAAGRP